MHQRHSYDKTELGGNPNRGENKWLAHLMFLSVTSFSVLDAGSANLRKSSSFTAQLFDLEDSAEVGKSIGAKGVKGRRTGGLTAITGLETILQGSTGSRASKAGMGA